MSFFLGDLNSPSLPFSELPRLKYYFIIAIWVHYFLEVVINTHQSYLFVKQQSPTLTDSKEERPHANGRPSAVYRSWMACYWTNIINITLQYDLVPKLWTAAGRAIYYFGTPQTGELADILRTIWFLLFCYGIYAVLNVPELLIRVLYFKEDVLRVWRAKRKSHQIFHDAAQGRPMHLVILVVVESVIMLQGYGRRIDNQYLIITGLLQLVFALLYPILSQPRMKELTLMEDGKSKSALEELASNAGFPLKNLYTIEGHAMTPMIQTTGWPRKANIVINSSLLEECTTENLVALTVQKLGWWSNSSELRQLMISQLAINGQWTFLIKFLQQRQNYIAFGFGNDYPTIALVALYALCIAPVAWAVMGVCNRVANHHFDFFADKYAAELGYSTELSEALVQVLNAGQPPLTVSRLYSIYHLDAPAVSERLSRLEKLRAIEEQKEGLIVLPVDEKQ